MPPRKEPEPVSEGSETVEEGEELATLEELNQVAEKLMDLTERVTKLESGSPTQTPKSKSNPALAQLEEQARTNPSLKLIYQAITGESD